MQNTRTEAAAYFPTPMYGPMVEALTIADFCRAYGVGRSYTYEEIRAGRLPVRKAGRRTLIPVEGARQWFNGLSAGSAA